MNRSAFLTTIAFSEGTLNLGDNGYNVMIGGKLFDSYKTHPHPHVWCKRINAFSSAAGRYQIMYRFYVAYKEQLKLPDFSPASQDKIALQLIRECKALEDIDAGKIKQAITKCRSRWASFPGAGYGQRENAIDKLIQVYVKAGGALA